MIRITERAAKKALTLAAKDGNAPILRVGVKGGGCTGLSYHMDFDGRIRDTDKVWEVVGLTVVCDPKSAEILEGTELDFDPNILMGGFKFKNPNAKRSCGCGESFSI